MDFPVIVRSAVRDMASEPVGFSIRASPGAGAAIHAADSRADAAVGSADCALSGFAVAQILAASTFPEQVVEADRWVQAHPDLKGDALGKSCGPATLGSEREGAHCLSIRPGKYGQNLSWASSLGDALLQPSKENVMDAIQVDAQAGGTSRQS